jgi:hypothetical protein
VKCIGFAPLKPPQKEDFLSKTDPEAACFYLFFQTVRFTQTVYISLIYWDNIF